MSALAIPETGSTLLAAFAGVTGMAGLSAAAIGVEANGARFEKVGAEAAFDALAEVPRRYCRNRKVYQWLLEQRRTNAK